MNGSVIATLTNNETGQQATLTSEQLQDAISSASIGEELDNSLSIVDFYGPGLIAIDIHPENIEAFDGVVHIGSWGEGGLRPGRYLVLYDFNMRARMGSKEENEEALKHAADGFLLAIDEGQIVGDKLTPEPVTVRPQDDNDEIPEPGEAAYEPMEVWAIRNEDTGGFLTLSDMLQGLSAMAALKIALDFYGEALFAGQAEPVTLPKQDTVKPRTQIDPNSKLANKITLLANGETVNLDVSGPQEKRAVTTVVTLEYEGDGIELAKPMTQYDREVHNAVTTLWKAGNTSFTARQVWHTLTDTDAKKPPSREQMARIEESIDKQRFTRAVVDFTEEARGRELTLDGEPVTAYKIDAYMLNAEKHTIETANGRTVEGYTITRPPVLYQHASIFGQVVTYPMRYLKAAGSVGKNSEENIVIRKYLLRRIGMAKGKGHASKRIKYSSVYDKAGIAEPDKKQRKRINDFVVSCLEALAKEGAIKGFTEYKEGRARAGVDLIV